MKRIPLIDGRSSVALSLSEDDLKSEVTVAVDPFGEYQEADESNNTLTIASAGTCPIEEISIESGSDCIRISIPAGRQPFLWRSLRGLGYGGNSSRLLHSCAANGNSISFQEMHQDLIMFWESRTSMTILSLSSPGSFSHTWMTTCRSRGIFWKCTDSTLFLPGIIMVLLGNCPICEIGVYWLILRIALN